MCVTWLCGNAFDELQPIREQAYEGDPVAMEELIKGRLEAQEAIGISDYAKAPLTNSELQIIAAPVAGAVDRQTWDQLFSKIDETYGPYADEVMTQILHWKGLHKEAATVATSMLRQVKLGERPSRLVAKSFDQKMGALETETAMDGGFETIKWKASPNNSQINHLLANPDLADQFDDKFGSGASDFYFKAQRAQQTANTSLCR